MSARSRTVLPAPFGPMIARQLAFGRLNETPRTTSAPPRRTPRSSTSNAFIGRPAPPFSAAAFAAAKSSVRESSEIATDAHDITAARLTCEQLLARLRHFLQPDDCAHDEPLDLARLPLAGELLPHGKLPGPRHLDRVYAEEAHAPQHEGLHRAREIAERLAAQVVHRAAPDRSLERFAGARKRGAGEYLVGAERVQVAGRIGLAGDGGGGKARALEKTQGDTADSAGG